MTSPARSVAILALVLGLGCNGNGLETDAPDLPAGADASVRADAAHATDCPSPITGFRDRDGDGHGAAETARPFCDGLPLGWVSIDNDCNDACVECSPIGVEACDGLDNDCDGLIDDGLERERFYVDADGDGFGAGEHVDACVAPQGHVPLAGDCRDDDFSVSPGVKESCNAIDDDCDGLADDGLLALETADVFLGDANATFREIALAGWEGGWLAAWTGADRRVMFLNVGAEQSVDAASARAVAPIADELAGQATPAVAVVRGETGRWGVISWADGETIRVRGVRLADGALGPILIVSRSGDAARLPLVVQTTETDVAIVWRVSAARQETHARLFEPESGRLGDEATIFVGDRTSPDNWGPSAVVLPSEPDVLLLGVVNLVYPDAMAVGYVHRVQLRPQIAPISTRSARLPPSDGRAADRIVLAHEVDGDSRSDRVLAFVSSGGIPEQVTDVFEVRPLDAGPVTATAVATLDGFALDAMRAPDGADVVLRSYVSTDRVLLSLSRVAVHGAAIELGPLDDTLLPPTWAAIGQRTATRAAAMWTGRVGESDVDPGVWLRLYGCNR
jgi:hypothetical protein